MLTITKPRVLIGTVASMLVVVAAGCSGGASTPPMSPSPATSSATPAASATTAASAPPAASATPAPDSTPPAPGTPAATEAAVVYRGNTSRRAVALTFDTGADAGNTGAILDALQAEHVRATFSVTGLWAEQHRDLLLAIAAAGHQIINGGYHGTTRSPAIDAARRRSPPTQRAARALAHRGHRLPPHRPQHPPVLAPAPRRSRRQRLRDAAGAGYPTPSCRTTTRGLDRTHPSTRSSAAACSPPPTPNAIYVLHADADRRTPPRSLASSTDLRAQGFALAAIEDVLAR